MTKWFRVFDISQRTIATSVLMLGFTTSLHAQFLVKDQEYRCPPSAESCNSPHHLSSVEERTTTKGNRFTINFVEYNDKGELWNKQELSDALAQVRSARADGSQNVLVMVYIHGWQNNADDVPGSCQDVCKFRDTLLVTLADEQAESGKPLKVVGIYLAWRGLSFTVEPFKHIVSYWPRRGVARHVGQTGMYDALTQIEHVIAEKRQNYVLVLAGHSFGARVLENAADTSDRRHIGFMLDYMAKERTLANQQQIKSVDAFSEESRALNTNLPADLIFYVNAATASTVTRRTIRDIRQTCQDTPSAPICGADPFYLAVTSHADLPTGIIMPIANLVFPALTSDALHLISAANTPSLHTHADPAPINECPQVQGPNVCFTVAKGPPSVKKSVDRIPGKEQIPGKKADPFWIFNVGKDVSDSHGDVWNAAVTDLVTQVIVRNQRYRLLSMQMAAR